MIRRPHPTPAEKKKICSAAREGHTITHLSQIFHYHRNSISQWIKEDQQGTDFARKTSPGSGRVSKIDCVIGARLLDILKQPASKYGFENDCWTTPRIGVVCQKHLGVKVSRMAIFRTLNRYEYAYKTPQRQYYETNVAAQKRWLKTVLPEINKLVTKKRRFCILWMNRTLLYRRRLRRHGLP